MQSSAFAPRRLEIVLVKMSPSTELLLSPCLGLDGRNFMYNLLCNMTAMATVVREMGSEEEICN